MMKIIKEISIKHITITFFSALLLLIFITIMIATFLNKGSKQIEISQEPEKESLINATPSIENIAVIEDILKKIEPEESLIGNEAEYDNSEVANVGILETDIEYTEPVVETEDIQEVPADEGQSFDLIIGIAADSHAGQAYGFDRFSRGIKELKKHKIDALVELGDFIENRKGYKQIEKSIAKSDYNKAKQIISGDYTLISVLGNHDVLSLSKDSLKKLSGRNNYYSTKIDGYNIIVLDANYTSKEESIEEDYYDTKGKNKLITYNGSLPKAQLEWLENQLQKNKKNLIFSHHPLHNISNADAVSEILNKHKKNILFSANGHKHPQEIRSNIFGGIKNYEIPSLHHQKSFAIFKIKGKKIEVITHTFQ